MRTARIWFTKLGRARFISHLDINRCMARAVRRAKIPLWYTEGFHPHPYMTFSLPLSLGIASECESMDIRVEGEMTDEEIRSRLDAVMPEGIRVTRVAGPVCKAKEIAFAVYEITVETRCPEDTAIRLKTALERGELIAQKKGKQGRKRIVKEVNLMEYVHRYAVEERETCVVLRTVLHAGTVKNVNPMLLMETLMKQAGAGEPVSIVRKQLLLEDETEFQ